MVNRVLESMGLSKNQAIEQSTKLIDAQCKSIAHLIEIHNKPIVGFTFHSLQEHFIKNLLNQGVPVFPGPERAVRALNALVQYYRLREKFSQ